MTHNSLMNKLRLLVGGMFVIILTWNSMALHSQQIDPITQAMLNGLTETLKQNPNDYITLYDRAATYYRLSKYDDALNDLQKALTLTPGKESELLAQELSLLADTNVELKQYEKALEAIEKAIEIQQTYPLIYKKGNILLYLERPEEAFNTFSSLQRMKSRSQEAYFGMAKAKIMSGDNETAKSLLKEAQDADVTNYITYCRVGDLYVDLGEDENAAANYLSAFALNSENTRPLMSLIKLADRNYPAFSAAIDYAISRTNNKLPMYFLKGNIACNSGHYREAKDAFAHLLNMPEGKEGFVYARMAEACRNLNLLSEAQNYIDLALVSDKRAENYVLKSEIEAALGNSGASLLAARNAIAADPNNIDAMIAQAMANIAFGDSKEAVANLNEAVMSDPTSLKTLMIRAWLYGDILKDEKNAVADYSRVSAMEAESFPDIAFKGLARYKNGKILDADAIVENGLMNNPTKDDYYWAAVYYAQTGNLNKSKEMVDMAKKLGFQNEYLLLTQDQTNLTLAPIRHLLKGE